MSPTNPRYLEGKNLYLRPIDPRTDIERYYAWMNDPEVTNHLLYQTPMPFPAEETYVRNVTEKRPSTNFVFAVVLFKKDEHIGSVDIRDINWIDRTGVMGILIGEKRYWGHGYGFEIAMLGAYVAFRILNLRKLCSSAIESNTPSIATHLKCGCKKIGVRKAQRFRNGNYVDEVLFEQFVGDFEKAWKKHQHLVESVG